ncbi:CPXCG motif-containing cysteine-rich protein [Elongatibacter sediminis]|uniref:CPXCG motif-containing cysteine-rich protein n=1 Tax=Elongatibacter sediminis TaxID=3119006 RepID=A0AAW9REN1_9GAMM
MTDLHEADIDCPYCGENITVLIDPSVPVQRYTEDCSVCCQPILVEAAIDAADQTTVRVTREND